MTQAELRTKLLGAGLSATLWQLPDDSYEPCSIEFVLANWQAWLDSRPAELCLFEDVAGKSIRTAPRWVANAGDCDNLGLGTMAWADCGNALKAVQTSTARGGLAYGVMFYDAAPARPDNFNVSGPHCINWFVDQAGWVRFFEPGQGKEVYPTAIERASAWFGLAA